MSLICGIIPRNTNHVIDSSFLDCFIFCLYSIIAMWTYPSDSEYTEAKITCTTNYHDKTNCEDKTASKDESSVSYDGLIPGAEYEFTVTVVSNGQSSPPSSTKSQTLGNKYLFV